MEKLSKRDLRRLARILLEEYMSKINVVNSSSDKISVNMENRRRRRDLNPGHGLDRPAY